MTSMTFSSESLNPNSTQKVETIQEDRYWEVGIERAMLETAYHKCPLVLLGELYQDRKQEVLGVALNFCQHDGLPSPKCCGKMGTDSW
jgi:hypothetical protein